MPISSGAFMRFVKSVLPTLLLIGFLSTVGHAAVADRIAGPLSAGRTITLKGNVSHKALPQYDEGPVDPGMRLGTITLLTLPTASQQKALDQLLADQQNPKSPSYHKWLTVDQFADRFGLSQKDMQQMAAWLKSQGFSSIQVAHGRNFISFNGTAAQVQSAFGTEIHRYNVKGELHYANATAPSIPAAMGGVVVGIRGLHDFRPRSRMIRRDFAARPYYDSSTYGDLIAPGDIAAIYDISALYNSGITGAGQKLAVMGQSDIYLSDITNFRTGFGLSAISCTTNASGVITACNDSHFQYVLDGTDPGPSAGDISESDLDIEWSGATAQDALIIFVNSTNVFDSYYYAIDNQSTLGETVISLSYGLCEFEDNTLSSDEVQLKQANTEGITFLNSAGDDGAAECDPDAPGPNNTIVDPNGASAEGGFAVSYPASSPEVTGVGGTSIAFSNLSSSTYWGTTNETNGGTATGYIPEVAWNDDAEFATYCQGETSSSDPGYDFCNNGGGTAGWVPITTAQNVQTDFALGPDADGISSSGGGPSNCAQQTTDFSACVSGFPQPSWQTVTVSGQTAARFSPDVSLLATPNFPGYIFCTELSEISDSGTGSSCAPGGSAGITSALGLANPSIIGGTSVSTPIFAGIVALLNQSLGTNGLGNINPMLYSLAATPSNGAFHQVTSGSNLVYCTPGTPTYQPASPAYWQCPSNGVLGFQASNADSTTGYNLVTGLGSVDADKLATAWNNLIPAQFVLKPTAGSFQVSPGASVNATVNVTLASGFTGTLVFTCTDPAPDSICTVPSPINAAGQVSFAISTTAPTASLRNFGRPQRLFYAALLPGLLGILFTAGSRRRSLRGMRFMGLIVALGFSTLWLGSCGGSSTTNPSGGTTPGSYTVNVSATSSGAPTQTTTFQLVVQ
jgi:subtilase family serine protease